MGIFERFGAWLINDYKPKELEVYEYDHFTLKVIPKDKEDYNEGE